MAENIYTMGLAIISLPNPTIQSTNKNPAISDYTISVSEVKFTGFKPLNMQNNVYRYLVSPGTDETK